MPNAHTSQDLWSWNGPLRTRYDHYTATLDIRSDGLFLGPRTCIARIASPADGGALVSEGALWDECRARALLSVAYNCPISSWQMERVKVATVVAVNQPVSAGIILAHAGFGRIPHSPDTAERLYYAEKFLDSAASPYQLLDTLGLLPPDWVLGKSDMNWDEAKHPRDAQGRFVDISPEEGKRITGEASQWHDTQTFYASLGDRYAGAKAMKGVRADCSGSAWKIYQNVGFPYRYLSTHEFAQAAAQPDSHFRKLNPGEKFQEGDIVLYLGHMGLYAGKVNGADKIWNASHHGAIYGQGNMYVHGREVLGVYRYRKKVP